MIQGKLNLALKKKKKSILIFFNTMAWAEIALEMFGFFQPLLISH